MPKPISYSDAGVSIDNANLAVSKIKEFAKTTFNDRTLSDIGSFGGMFDGAFPSLDQPILVASADGVGTKVKVAIDAGIHNTIGQDLVNHCVNDILVQGARPLFFLDYFATGHLDPDVTASVVEGVAIACKENGCVLLGGETAEMPGIYAEGDYDLAGFIVGIVDKAKVIDGSNIKEGDIIFGLPSDGLHTNGFSLARKLFHEMGGYKINDTIGALGESLHEALLKPHKSYLHIINGLLDTGIIKGLAHITGGGMIENIPRILPDKTSAEIKRGTWSEPPIYGLMQRLGNVVDSEMFRTFNMGIGMAIICDQRDGESLKEHFHKQTETLFEIGRIVRGSKEATIV